MADNIQKNNVQQPSQTSEPGSVEFDRDRQNLNKDQMNQSKKDSGKMGSTSGSSQGQR